MSAVITKPLRASFQHRFADFSLDVNFTLPGRGVTVLFGESGSGKTTLLRCLAGLQRADVGELFFGDQCWQDSEHFLSPHQRSLGYVFQEASLLTHLNVQENLDYARSRVRSKEVQAIAYDELLSLLAISELLTRRVQDLSGGERQRVAIARALLTQPQLLLMDEPLASLDQRRKQEILPYLEMLRDELNIPIVYVTHSMDELARLADQVIVLEQGKLVAQGQRDEVLTQLGSPLQAQNGAGVVLEATITAREEQWHLLRAQISGGELWLADRGQQQGETLRVRVLARDVSLTLTRHDDSSILNTLRAQVVEIGPANSGDAVLVRLQLCSDGGVVGSELVARITRRSCDLLGLGRGSEVWAQIKSVAVLR